MLSLLFFGLTLCTSVYGLIPGSNVCYQHAIFPSACDYGNLTVAFMGKVLTNKDCNSHLDVKDLENAPTIYINSTNTTERFTVVMFDSGPQGRGPNYIQWMLTNVSITTLPDYKHLPSNNMMFGGYQQPLLMHGMQQPTLIKILVLRHQNVLRVPFGELWVTNRRNFALSMLFSNTKPNLLLCGPVAGTQYWVHDYSSIKPSAPLPPEHPPHPVQPVYVPVVPVQPYVPVGSVPVQPGYVPQPGQPGVAPPPAQPGFVPAHQPPHMTFPKKSAGIVFLPMQIVFVPLVLITVMFL